MSTVVLYCLCLSDSASAFCVLHLKTYHFDTLLEYLARRKIIYKCTFTFKYMYIRFICNVHALSFVHFRGNRTLIFNANTPLGLEHRIRRC